MIGVVLTTFNMLALTRRCLESFHRCTTCPHKLVIVDNNSRDGTAEFLRRRGYEVIANRSHTSLPRAMNQGVERFLNDPDVEYVCWIENDMILLPLWLDNLVAVLRERPEIGKLGSFHIDGPVPSDQDVLAFVAREGNWLRLGNAIPWIMPKWAIREVGPHDEGFVHGGAYEDWDYNNRLLERGIPVMVTRRSLVWHGGNATTRGVFQPAQFEEQNRQHYARRWGHVHWGWCHPSLGTDRRLW